MSKGIQEEEELTTSVIPENFADTGRCFNGLFRTRNLIEALIFAAPIAFLIFNLDLGMEAKITNISIFAGSVFLLCVNGINGDSVIEFVLHFFAYKKKMRVARYNPRVKTEATPGYLTQSSFELPRDKVMRVISSITKKSQEEEAVSSDIYDPIYKPFFDDDIGIVDMPEDLKSKKQLRKEAKERRRAEKEAEKEAKCQAKAKAQAEIQAEKERMAKEKTAKKAAASKTPVSTVKKKVVKQTTPAPVTTAKKTISKSPATKTVKKGGVQRHG